MAEPVAVVVTNGDLGGGEVMALRCAHAARSLGHAVTVVGPSEPTEVVDAAADAGFSVVRIRAADRRAYVTRLRAWDRRERQGLLWGHGLLPGLATAGHRRRLVHLHQDPRGMAQRAAYRLAVARADAVLVPSEDMAARLPGTSALPNWSDEAPDLPDASRPDDGCRIVGFLGRQSQDKGLDVLAKAVAPLVRAGRVRLLVAGDSRYVPAEQQDAVRVALRALGDGVEVLGHVAREEFFARVDLAAFPSVWAEPFGLVVAEAMAARVPFVVSSAGALPEVAGRLHPWVARAGDMADLERVLDAALTAPPSVVTAAVVSARDRWESEYSPAAGLERVRRVLTRVGGEVSAPRIAIAHDYLTQRGGAERVVLSLLRAFPDATLHTLLYDPESTYPEFRAARIVTSPLDRVGAFRRDPRRALPLLAAAASRFRVDADVVVASTSGWAHGFAATGRVLAYCHNPARWIYQTDEYLGRPAHRHPVGLPLLAARPLLRAWDQRAASRVDRYLANARVVAERIEASYGVSADVVPAPHSMHPEAERHPIPELFGWPRLHLLVSRLLPYKNVHAAIEAYRGTEHRLVVVGRGPEERRLRELLPANVVMLSGLSDSELRWLYGEADLLLAPSYEDFGLTPLEAGAFGTPVVALRAGGYLDTVVEDRTGVFFAEPTTHAIRAAVLAATTRSWDPAAIRAHAETFSEDRFVERLRAEVAALSERPRP